MLEELTPIVLQVLITNQEPATLDVLMELSGCERTEIVKVLNLLVDLELVVKEKSEKQTTYSLIRELKGIHLAKAAHLGIDLNAFDSYFKIDKKEKKLAMELASQVDKIKHLEVSKRKPLMQKRGYLISDKSDDVQENLALIHEAANNILYEYLEKLSQKDAHLKLLMSMHEEAENSLRNHFTSLN
jgi:hypothetical protein